MIDGHEVTSTITIRKRRIAPDQKWAARDILRAHVNGNFRGGQLIIHYDPAGNPVWIEVQERQEKMSPQLALAK
jgi:hypothetical protein